MPPRCGRSPRASGRCRRNWLRGAQLFLLLTLLSPCVSAESAVGAASSLSPLSSLVSASSRILKSISRGLRSSKGRSLGEGAAAGPQQAGQSGQAVSEAGAGEVAGAGAVGGGPHSPRNCSLSVRLEKGSSWEYENCIYLSSGGGFTFHWTYDLPTRVLDGSFSAEWNGWLGWGMGVRMIGSNALVAFASTPDSSSFYVSRYFLAAYDPLEIRPNTGSLKLVNNSVQVHIQRGVVRVLFAATLPPEQAAGMYVIMAKGPGGDSKTGQLQKHDPTLTARTYIRLMGGGPPQWLQAFHGAVNIAAWGILMPVGVLVARHARDLEPLWFHVHRAIQVAAFGLGSFGFFLGLLMWGQAHEGRTKRRGWGGGDEGEYDPSSHRAFAVTLFVLACFQVTAWMGEPHKDALLRPWWNFLHHTSGRLILLLAVLNIWEGMALLHPAMPAWPYLYGIPLGLLIVTASLLEAFLLWRWLMDDTPSTALQRWVQALFPRSVQRRYTALQTQEQAGSLIELDEHEIGAMATRFQRDLEHKYT